MRRSLVQALQSRALDRYVLDHASKDRPILGICLGMQLLTNSSREDGYTSGLGLIPGDVMPIGGETSWHIGWNTVENVKGDPLFSLTADQAFYFNHSYIYQGPPEFQVCETRATHPFASAIRRNKIVGVQFHPEKSQTAGRLLFRHLLNGLSNG